MSYGLFEIKKPRRVPKQTITRQLLRSVRFDTKNDIILPCSTKGSTKGSSSKDNLIEGIRAIELGPEDDTRLRLEDDTRLRLEDDTRLRLEDGRLSTELVHLKNLSKDNISDLLKSPRTLYIGTSNVKPRFGCSFWHIPNFICNDFDRYRTYLNKVCKEKLGDLKGKLLLCNCDQVACHGQVILSVLNDL